MARRYLLLLVGLCLVLGACGSGEGTSTTEGETATTQGETSTTAVAAEPSTTVPSTGELDQVKVLVLPYISSSPYFIAMAEGYFEEQGIEIEVVNLESTEEVMPALISGQVDVASGLLSAGMLNAIARDADIAITADKGWIDPDGDCAPYALIGAASLVDAGELESADQLAGKNVNVVPATWLEYYMEKVLETGGLGLDDINGMNLGSAVVADALASGQLDAAINSEPFLTIFENQGHSEVLAPPQELLPGESTAVQVYGPSLLNDNRDLGVRFMAAYLKGVERYLEGPTEANIEIISENTQLEPGLLQNICWVSINPTGEVLVDGVLDFQDFAVERGYLEEVVPADEFYDGSFIEDARELLSGSG